jgi:hypothetical protein
MTGLGWLALAAIAVAMLWYAMHRACPACQAGWRAIVAHDPFAL